MAEPACADVSLADSATLLAAVSQTGGLSMHIPTSMDDAKPLPWCMIACSY